MRIDSRRLLGMNGGPLLGLAGVILMASCGGSQNGGGNGSSGFGTGSGTGGNESGSSTGVSNTGSSGLGPSSGSGPGLSGSGGIISGSSSGSDLSGSSTGPVNSGVASGSDDTDASSASGSGNSGAPNDDAGGAGSGASSGTSTDTSGPAPTKLPSAMGSCPTFTNGQATTITVGSRSMPVTMYIDPSAKSKPAPGGPLILYYHATGSTPIEVFSGFGQSNISKVTSMGGVVAAFKSTSCSGCQTTDDDVWFQQDGPIQDQVVACAMQQAKIDTRHIHALGWSAGALHSMWVAFARSDYMASVISYSGGLTLAQSEDPTNKVPAILTYGDKGTDDVIIDFNQASNQYYTTYSPMGYYIMMCHHPGGHEVDPMVAPLSLDFFMAEPYKVSPQPYAKMIPSMYPSYCHNTPM